MRKKVYNKLQFKKVHFISEATAEDPNFDNKVYNKVIQSENRLCSRDNKRLDGYRVSVDDKQAVEMHRTMSRVKEYRPE